MVFNWFRRQYTDKQDAEQVEAPDNADQTPDQKSESGEESIPAVAESTPEPVAEVAPEAATDPAAADRLAFAKAAYQRILERQQAAQAAATPVEAPPETTPEATVEEIPTIPEPASDEVAGEEIRDEVASEPEPIESVELVEPEPDVEEAIAEEPIAEVTSEQVESEPVAEIPATPEPLAAETPAEPEIPAPEPTPAEPAPLPFWARADADRQERLERLQAELASITLPQPSPAEAPAPTTQPDEVGAPQPALAEIELDEGFLWSTKVLAAQGRRPEDVSEEEINWLQKLRRGLGKTRQGLVNQLKAIVGKGPLSADAVSEIETLLLQADVGVDATDTIVQALQAKLRQEAVSPELGIDFLKQILQEILDRPFSQGYTPSFMPDKGKLNIWMMTGVNGVGKTTTIGKLAHVATKSGYKCLIGAGDTFRAAAVEQVKVWGQRSNVEVVANPGKNSDPAAVVFDAITAAQSRDVELLLVDTAGRLQNKQNLMEELRKIRRIVDKKAPDAQVESLLVLDATLGQNGLRQAQVFAEAAQLSGVVITKLDGSAKGGVALAVVQQLGLPIRFIGAGEGIEDLRPFSSYEFVEALLSS